MREVDPEILEKYWQNAVDLCDDESNRWIFKDGRNEEGEGSFVYRKSHDFLCIFCPKH